MKTDKVSGFQVFAVGLEKMMILTIMTKRPVRNLLPFSNKCKFSFLMLGGNNVHAYSVMSNSATPWTDCNPLGSSVHGILQARILEWGAISSSRGSSQPRDQMSPAWQTDSLPLNHLGSLRRKWETNKK